MTAQTVTAETNTAFSILLSLGITAQIYKAVTNIALPNFVPICALDFGLCLL